MDNPTREQMCAELARAMGWATELPAGFSLLVWVNPKSKIKQQYPPDPFTSADDSRALVLWLAENDKRWNWFRQELEKIRRSVSRDELLRFTLTAPLPVITIAAWRALTGASNNAPNPEPYSHGES